MSQVYFTCPFIFGDFVNLEGVEARFSREVPPVRSGDQEPEAIEVKLGQDILKFTKMMGENKIENTTKLK